MPMQSADGTPGRGCVARVVGSHEQSGSDLVDHDHYTVAISLESIRLGDTLYKPPADSARMIPSGE